MGYSRHGRRAIFAVCAAVAMALASPSPAQVVYINNNIPAPNNSVSALLVDGNGALTPIAGSPYLTGGGGSFTPNVGAVDVVAVGGFLYATNSLTNTIAAFEINGDGTLTTIPGSPFPTLGTRPNGIAINAAGTRLFAADFVSDSVSVFDVASNGALTLVAGAPFTVAADPVDLAIDSSNSLLFASHGSSGVGVYSIGVGGDLTAIVGSPFSSAGTGLRSLAINSAATRLYVANGLSDTVSGFSIAGGGTLTAVPGSPFATGTSPIGVTFHPTLSVLYVSNDLSDNISVYSIAGSGALTPIVGSPFASGGQGTSGMTIDAANGRLLAINGGTSPVPSRDVSVFDIGPAGELTSVPGSPFSTGVVSGRPGSITFVSILRPDCTAVAPGVCPTGRGRATLDCHTEWFVDTTPPPSINPRTNLPDFKINCQSGNPGCDFDSLDDRCTFRLRACINNIDPRLPACVPTAINTYEMLRPRPGFGDVFDAANLNQFQRAMSGGTCSNDAFRSCLVNADCLFGGTCTGAPVIGVPFVRRQQVLIPGAPNATANLCSNVMEIVVPLRATGTGFRARSRVLRTRAVSATGAKDTDVLKLTCFPGP